MTLGDWGAMVLAAPLIASSATVAWDGYWGGTAEGPLGVKGHRILSVAEAATALALLTPVVSTLPTLLVAGGLYLLLAAGAAVILLSRGPVPCGCWGTSGKTLSWPLVATNAGMAASALILAGTQTPRHLTAPQGALIYVGLTILGLLTTVVISDFKHALTGLTARASTHRRWFDGFPDLEDARP